MIKKIIDYFLFQKQALKYYWIDITTWNDKDLCCDCKYLSSKMDYYCLRSKKRYTNGELKQKSLVIKPRMWAIHNKCHDERERFFGIFHCGPSGKYFIPKKNKKRE